MKRINQLERTKSDITAALLRLLEAKPFEKITVLDIASEAKINRATFYVHFTDKFAVLEQLSDLYSDQLSQIMNAVNKNHDRIPLEEIDALFESYFCTRGPVLKKLISIQSPYINIRQKLNDFFFSYIGDHFPGMNELEIRMTAGLLTDFFVYHLTHDTLTSYVTTLFNSFQNITLSFFRMENNHSAKVAFGKLIEQYSWNQFN